MDLASQIRSLFDNPKSADIMLRVDGKIYHGHTCILIATSGFFKSFFHVQYRLDNKYSLFSKIKNKKSLSSSSSSSLYLSPQGGGKKEEEEEEKEQVSKTPNMTFSMTTTA